MPKEILVRYDTKLLGRYRWCAAGSRFRIIIQPTLYFQNMCVLEDDVNRVEILSRRNIYEQRGGKEKKEYIEGNLRKGKKKRSKKHKEECGMGGAGIEVDYTHPVLVVCLKDMVRKLVSDGYRYGIHNCTPFVYLKTYSATMRIRCLRYQGPNGFHSTTTCKLLNRYKQNKLRNWLVWGDLHHNHSKGK